MRGKMFAAIIVAFGLTSAAIAQSNPIIAHFTAYRAAIGAGDLATAEREAALALAASEERFGDGGRTAVLALNLAMTRLERNDVAGALQPAQRAVALARNGAAGIDPNLAELILGRIELATEGAAGASRISTLLEGPGRASLSVNEVHLAAGELAIWSMNQRQYALAQRAWAIAAETAAGSPISEPFARGRALTGEAAANILSQIGANGARRISNTSKQEIFDLLTEALADLSPLANVDNPTGALTIAQRAYAEALAWRNALTTKLRADGSAVPRTSDAPAEGDEMAELPGPLPLATPRCQLEKASGRVPTYPKEMLDRNQMGVVVLRIRLDESGAVTEALTAARVGNDDFSQLVEPLVRTWTYAKRANEPEGCRMPTTVMLPINFILH